PDDDARHAVETMVMAPMRLARLALPHMRAAEEGRIVNVSSIYGRTTTPLTGWYQGCKHALEALSDALRVEVASTGVKVVLVEPGGFKTGIWEEAEGEVAKRAGSRYEGAYRRTLQGTRLAQPLMGDPAQVAGVILTALTSRRPRPRYLVGVGAVSRRRAELVRAREHADGAVLSAGVVEEHHHGGQLAGVLGGDGVPVRIVLVVGELGALLGPLQVHLRREGAHLIGAEDMLHRLGQPGIAPQLLEPLVDVREGLHHADGV